MEKEDLPFKITTIHMKNLARDLNEHSRSLETIYVVNVRSMLVKRA